MKVIFVGGCHLVGKPHGVSAGFVRRLWKRWRKLDREVHFELLPNAFEWAALFSACREALVKKPDFLVLNIQSGLVLPTWDRTMKRWGIKKRKIWRRQPIGLNRWSGNLKSAGLGIGKLNGSEFSS